MSVLTASPGNAASTASQIVAVGAVEPVGAVDSGQRREVRTSGLHVEAHDQVSGNGRARRDGETADGDVRVHDVHFCDAKGRAVGVADAAGFPRFDLGTRSRVPGAPVAPAGPVGPAGPVAPAVPGGPAAPSLPSSPEQPAMPAPNANSAMSGTNPRAPRSFASLMIDSLTRLPPSTKSGCFVPVLEIHGGHGRTHVAMQSVRITEVSLRVRELFSSALENAPCGGESHSQWQRRTITANADSPSWAIRKRTVLMRMRNVPSYSPMHMRFVRRPRAATPDSSRVAWQDSSPWPHRPVQEPGACPAKIGGVRCSPRSTASARRNSRRS